MRHSIKLYILTAVVCIIALAIVQFFLIYNTYQLLDSRFNYVEKGRIGEAYNLAIANDKLFPGGQPLLDSIIVPQYPYLEQLYHTNPKSFDTAAQRLVNRIIRELVQHENTDSMLKAIKASDGIKDSLLFALCIHRLDLRFKDSPYVNIYNRFKKYPLIPASRQKDIGLYICGNLQQLSENSSASSLVANSPLPYSYSLSFSFYADPYNRRTLVLQQMKYTILPGLLTLLAVITLFGITLFKWIRQKHLSDMKSDFINNITHEFNTPITAIIVANKNIQNEKTLENKQSVTALSEIIHRQAERLKLLVEKVINIAATEKLALRITTTDLNELISGILAVYSLNTMKQAIRFNFHSSGDPAMIETDTFHFTTLLQNILDNAVKYNDQVQKEITITTRQLKDTVELIIQDNGIGMNSITLRHIFEKFYRHQPHLSKPTKGLGLGLYYVKQCIDAHGWTIKVTSEPGAGSTFIITIPSKI
ncbi:sensor histidine kinase [Chitinophaga arvensicola]|uniref:histidine kinase n=1 Tax=Chitinophaga arvensicola TaxID=29529 RepID=A0A1I0S8U0_9BACT|nr:HAMP domain-containing sensor histidine kinase [Chitinophaga arvensicola]SEW52542.1 two-component system, OmpR family, phosphate regulon sensor histidine kinase PhoR [Chitinophaga arvensicola]